MTNVLAAGIRATAICLVIIFCMPAQAQTGTPIDPEPGRVALLWHQLTGVNPNVDHFVRNSRPYVRARASKRDRVYSDLVRKIESDLSSINPQNDTYVFRMEVQMSAYDSSVGGFFLPLFSGASSVPIRHGASRRDKFAQKILAGEYQLHFINHNEFVFWPMSEAEARAFVARVGYPPRVKVRFQYRPLMAPKVPYIDGSERRIYGQVLKVEVMDRRNRLLLALDTRLAEGTVRSMAEGGRLNPSADVMSMMWHKIAGGPAYDAEQLVQSDVNTGPRFTQADRRKILDAFYQSLEPSQPFTMLVEAEFKGYNPSAQEFPLRIERPTPFKTSFPANPYADERERVAKINRGKPGELRMRPFTGTEFTVDFLNVDQIGGLEVGPVDAARLRPDPDWSYRAQALLFLVPVKAETVKSSEGTATEKRLYTNIARARIFDKDSGQLIMEKTFDVPVYVDRVAHNLVVEGLK
ncbi:MAG: hypothetical protein AAGF15_09110 [Pseudomonadota bacterium]